MLQQDPDEPLVGPHQRPVDHHRPMLGVVGAGVDQAKALRHVEVHLDGTELPGAAERIGHVHVDLGTVERAVALVEVVLQPLVLQPLTSAASLLSHSSSDADPLLGPRRKLQSDIEPEDPVSGHGEVHARPDLLLELVLGTEDVGVVLSEMPDPEQAVERPAGSRRCSRPGSQ